MNVLVISIAHQAERGQERTNADQDVDGQLIMKGFARAQPDVIEPQASPKRACKQCESAGERNVRAAADIAVQS